jgi:hypothetical protein
MWVTKLNMLKSNPQNSPNKDGADQSSLAAASAAANPQGQAKAAELNAVTHNGQTDPNVWSKRRSFGCC